MRNKTKLRIQYIAQGGLLDGTVLEPMMAFVGVLYPHRKTKDLYVPPIEGKCKTWHCCQDNCPNPDFEVSDLISHLESHAGRLLRKRKLANV